MRTFILGLALATLSLAPAGAHAQTAQPTIQQMLPACEAAASGQATDPLVGYCFGVAGGVTMVMAFNCFNQMDGSAAPNPNFAAALPPSNQAAVQAWLNWVRANPARWGDLFTTSFMEAMRETFPCGS